MRITAKVNFLVGIPLLAFCVACFLIVYSSWTSYKNSEASYKDIEEMRGISRLVQSLQDERTAKLMNILKKVNIKQVIEFQNHTDLKFSSLTEENRLSDRSSAYLSSFNPLLKEAREGVSLSAVELYKNLILSLLTAQNRLGKTSPFEEIVPQLATIAILEKAKESSRQLHDLKLQIAVEDEPLNYSQINNLLDSRGGVDANLKSPGLILEDKLLSKIASFDALDHWKKSGTYFGTIFAFAADGEYELDSEEVFSTLTKITDDIVSVKEGRIKTLESMLVKSKVNAQTVLIGLVGGLATILAVIALISKTIITGITVPLGKAVKSINALSEGSLTTKIDVSSKDEVGEMAEAFNYAITSMKDTLQIDVVNWDHLAEQKKREQEATNNMKTLLAGLTQGVFFFDKSGHIADERSDILSSILLGSESVSTIFDLFSKFGKREKSNIDNCLEILFPEDPDGLFLIDFEVSAAMLPQRVHQSAEAEGQEDRIVDFQYSEFFDSDGKLDKIMVFVSDVTKSLKDEQEARVQRERVTRIGTGVRDVKSYQLFFDETCKVFKATDEIFKGGLADNETLAVLKRTLHTIKGNVRTFDFQTISDEVHALEDTLQEYGMDGLERMRPEWEAVKDRWKFETNDLNKILGLESNTSNITVKRSRLKDIADYAQSKKQIEIVQMVHEIEFQTVEEVLAKHLKMARRIAENSESKSIEFSFGKENSEIALEELARIDGALGHIFRNMVDHGVESTDERRGSGKSEIGKISIECYRVQSGGLHLVIADDGKGIDSDRLSQKAVENRYWTEQQAKEASQADKVNLIFTNGLSSKETVSATSGRGVGMDAVKNEIEGLGGSISVFTSLGQGTQFEVDLPPMLAGWEVQEELPAAS